ncbi:hypothetical protein [Rhodovulum visakhapatnamense]|uniref:Uncharacterized protein n=1 Tax=Rhodovulum visakhapatnamense TaxID=364297 RepID=A0A4R8G036_9RHOB|nr:hypothetical protein [Rhodovulum visakhapatnamense]TDX31329.1 hypothetical protein EV657_105177 [Rhodovulum visakhapatnamense]
MSDRPDHPADTFFRAFLVSGFFAFFVLLVLVWVTAGYGWALALAGAIWFALHLAAA